MADGIQRRHWQRPKANRVHPPSASVGAKRVDVSRRAQKGTSDDRTVCDATRKTGAQQPPPSSEINNHLKSALAKGFAEGASRRPMPETGTRGTIRSREANARGKKDGNNRFADIMTPDKGLGTR